ncbi:MAG TPA: cytochrome c oxidase assembly protein [Thermoanaerobaculia bacterium]|nr:cytochrome c oxidase assembly protein [Thermoanaerobaculia bacterium]
MRLIWNALVVIAMSVSLALYFRGVLRMRARSERGIRPWEASAFALGWATIAAALLSPIARISDVLFSVHMTQHELLMLVAAPLIVAGRPMVAGVWGISPRTRDALLRVTRAGVVQRSWHALTNPFFVLVLHGAVLWAWHVPAAFEWALHNNNVHAMQHLMFFVTAALFWWAIIHGRYGRLGYGVAVFFVFATALHTTLLGVLLTYANHLWYPTYAHTAPHALEDQQLAGLIMWVPAGALLTLIALALFAAWLGESDRRARGSSALTMLVLIVLLARCTDYPGDRKAAARQATRGGDPDRGKVVLRSYGCGSCHTIPGVPGAESSVGPPLDKIATRTYLAGRINNNPQNMMLFIRKPRSVDPKTAMPDMDVTETDGRDMTAYLLTLK